MWQQDASFPGGNIQPTNHITARVHHFHQLCPWTTFSDLVDLSLLSHPLTNGNPVGPTLPPSLRTLASQSSSSRYLSIALSPKFEEEPPGSAPSFRFRWCSSVSSASSAKATYAFATCQSTSLVNVCSRFPALSRCVLASRSCTSFVFSVRGKPGSWRADSGNIKYRRVCRRCGVVRRVLGGRLFKRQSSCPYSQGFGLKHREIDRTMLTFRPYRRAMPCRVSFRVM
jgi:hypothetical protein